MGTTNENYPSELLLGIFFNSEEDMSDSLYVSFDGIKFYYIGMAYEDATKTDAEHWTTIDGRGDCLHDPGLFYKDGVFWSMSGFTLRASGDSSLGDSNRFVPMWGWASSLNNWSYPGSGSVANENVRAATDGAGAGSWPYTINGDKNNKDFDCVAPDPFLDDDGTVYVVVSMGYWGLWHNKSSWDDVMKPYLVKVPRLLPGTAPIVASDDTGTLVNGKYNIAVPINLKVSAVSDERDTVRKGEDRIDGSLYKENGKYYLIIKRYGTTIELWSIDSLNNVSNPNAWTLVSKDILTGYEGPCIAKYGNQYFVYVDKLADYPPGEQSGTGIYVTRATTLDSGTRWVGKRKVNLVRVDKATGTETACEGRHGTVRMINNASAISHIMSLYNSVTGRTYNSNTDRPGTCPTNGWRYADGKTYYYENGTAVAGAERYLEYDTNRYAWFWFDADGTMARNKDVFIPYNADRTEGKWVYYDIIGRMVYGEHYHNGQWEYYDTTTASGGYWYYYDPVTGERATGFKDIPVNGESRTKRVYYDSQGRMVYGELCLNGDWYRFNSSTGEMIRGEYQSPEGNWYYYDIQTGIMQKGWVTLPDGSVHYYDEITGIRQS